MNERMNERILGVGSALRIGSSATLPPKWLNEMDLLLWGQLHVSV